LQKILKNAQTIIKVIIFKRIIMNIKSIFLVVVSIFLSFQDVNASWMPVTSKEREIMTVRCFDNKIKTTQWYIDNATGASRLLWIAKKEKQKEGFATYVTGKGLTPAVVARMIADAEHQDSSLNQADEDNQAEARRTWNDLTQSELACNVSAE
jgi:hypothetical protein